MTDFGINTPPPGLKWKVPLVLVQSYGAIEIWLYSGVTGVEKPARVLNLKKGIQPWKILENYTKPRVVATISPLAGIEPAALRFQCSALTN